ncbi:AMP-binding protein [Luteibaculum oceani]|uniref:AMP-binding protein n=1 Tax=Luteibaculum oceani TaxID=1294296 RepID=A0A5C6V863_9FLAO|nr:AMP-binding protein [Luteibaculum oceani]TXC81513.1 AMP-binding protein [Luteibaculum oceani]
MVKLLGNKIIGLNGDSEAIQKAVEDIINEWENKELIKFQTSGSTGKAKQISFPREAIIDSAKISGDFFNWSRSTVALCPLGLNYVAGKMMVLRAITLQFQLDIIAPTSLTGLGDLSNYDFAPLVPMQLDALLVNNIPLPKTILIGGAQLGKMVGESIKKQNPRSKIFHGYGMTETLTHCAIREIHPKFSESYQVLNGFKITSNKNGTTISAKHLPSPVITTDILEIDKGGNFCFKGRKDFIINSGAHKINPLEIEDLLSKIISPSFIVGPKPDERLGQKAVLIVEGHPDFNLTLDEIKGYLLGKTNKYNFPKELVIVPRLKYTPTGKIDRLASIREL